MKMVSTVKEEQTMEDMTDSEAGFDAFQRDSMRNIIFTK
jgi:hypothetical protein